MKPTYSSTDYGFEWGAVKVERIASDERRGWVIIGFDTPKTKVQIYATQGGKVRIYVEGEEVYGGKRTH